MDILIVIALSLVGILLILAEIFLIPGLTLTILAGIAASIGGVYYAFTRLGTTAGIIDLVVTVIVIIIACIYLVKSKTLDKTISLNTNIDFTVTSADVLNVKIGDIGVTLSRLNPMGKVKIGDTIMEGRSIDDYVDEKTEIVVVKVTPTQLIVKTK